MKIKILIICFITIIIGIYLYNKNVEKKGSEATMKEIIKTRKEYRNKQNIDTYSYLSNNEVALAGQKFMEKSLRAPSTAKFAPLFKSQIKKIKTGHYTVSSYVDSQNGFGAMIRSNYTVEIQQTKNGEIQLINIDIVN